MPAARSSSSPGTSRLSERLRSNSGCVWGKEQLFACLPPLRALGPGPPRPFPPSRLDSHTLFLPTLLPQVATELAAQTLNVAALREHVQRLEYQMAEGLSTLSGGGMPSLSGPSTGAASKRRKAGA